MTGVGVRCAGASGAAEFTGLLRRGVSTVTHAPVPGVVGEQPWPLGLRARLTADPRQLPETAGVAGAVTAGRLRRLVNRATRAVQHSVACAVEAWTQAGAPAPDDAALVVAGSNLTQGLSYEMTRRYLATPEFVTPSYARQFWDSDVLGVVSEALGLHGDGMTVGGASAGSAVGLVRGLQLVQDGRADVCLVVAPLTELSPVELMAFHQLGALGGVAGGDPATVCRPFDTGHSGFVYGEGSAALVLESAEHAAARGATALAEVRGGAVVLDGNHGTDPSADGEAQAVRRALHDAGVDPAEVDYVNAHATSTPLGDRVECEALEKVFSAAGARPWVNSTKSVVGHCLGAAAAVEAVACVQQIREGFVHANVNLHDPVTGGLRLAPPDAAVDTPVRVAVSTSFGFGGVNTCTVLTAPGVAAR